MSVTKEEVRELREQVQVCWELGEAQAKGKAAELVHGSLRAWQNWELGARSMPIANKELLEIKISRKRAANNRREKSFSSNIA